MSCLLLSIHNVHKDLKEIKPSNFFFVQLTFCIIYDVIRKDFILAFRQEQIWVRDVTMGWESHHSLDVLSSRWRWALYIPSIYCSTFHLGSLTSQVSGAFWWVHPPSYYLRLPVYILFAGPLISKGKLSQVCFRNFIVKVPLFCLHQNAYFLWLFSVQCLLYNVVQT